MTNQKYEIINISKDFKYVSELPDEILSKFDNCYIDKTLTGCGFTTWVLQNAQNYVVAVPFQGLIDCKVKQAKLDTDFYPFEIMSFHSGIDNIKDELYYYLERNKGATKKIMVTYDSVPRLLELLAEFNEDYKNDYRLLIDEAHKVLEFAGYFKPEVIYNLERVYHNFKAMIAVTATPTREDFIPDAFNKLKLVKLDWENKVLVCIKHKRIAASQLKDVVIAQSLAHLRNEAKGNAYFYVNSVSFSVALVKLLTTTFGFDASNFNIICGKNETNRKLLKSVKLTHCNDLDEYFKINFVTSTAFEGQDFLDPDGVTYIISNGKLEHTRIDISTQMPQIIGRLRRSKYKNNINFIWTYSFTNGETNFDKYCDDVMKEDKAFDEALSQYHLLHEIYKTYTLKCAKDDVWLLILDNKDGTQYPIKNPNAAKQKLNNFIGTQIQYFAHIEDGMELDDIKCATDNLVHNTLNDILSGIVECNLQIPELTATDKLLCGKIPDFSKILKEYAQAIITKNAAQTGSAEWHNYDKVITAIKANDAYQDIVEYVEKFGPTEALKYAGLSSTRVKAKLDATTEVDDIAQIMLKEFKVGDIIMNKDVKAKISDALTKHGYNSTKKPKREFLSYAFKVTQSTIVVDGKHIGVVKLG